MNWLDWLIILSLLGYVWGGLVVGLIQSIGGVVGLFLGGIIASRTYDHFGNVLQPIFGDNAVVGDIVAFILIFLIVSRLVSLAFFLVNKMFNLIAIVPGMKLFNKVGGALFGFIEGALFAGITLQFISRLPVSTPLAGAIADSQLAQISLNIAAWLVPLFPAVLKDAQNTINKVLPK